jgi:hypothetical protein
MWRHLVKAYQRFWLKYCHHLQGENANQASGKYRSLVCYLPASRLSVCPENGANISSEMLINFYQCTRRHILRDLHISHVKGSSQHIFFCYSAVGLPLTANGVHQVNVAVNGHAHESRHGAPVSPPPETQQQCHLPKVWNAYYECNIFVVLGVGYAVPNLCFEQTRFSQSILVGVKELSLSRISLCNM